MPHPAAGLPAPPRYVRAPTTGAAFLPRGVAGAVESRPGQRNAIKRGCPSAWSKAIPVGKRTGRWNPTTRLVSGANRAPPSGSHDPTPPDEPLPPVHLPRRHHTLLTTRAGGDHRLPAAAGGAAAPGGIPPPSRSRQPARAGPEVMAATVAGPLERVLGQIAGVTEMTSTQHPRSTRVTLQFDLSRSIDGAAPEVQAAINAGAQPAAHQPAQQPHLPQGEPADSPILILALTSATMSPGPDVRRRLHGAGPAPGAGGQVGQVTHRRQFAAAVRVELRTAWPSQPASASTTCAGHRWPPTPTAQGRAGGRRAPRLAGGRQRPGPHRRRLPPLIVAWKQRRAGAPRRRRAGARRERTTQLRLANGRRRCC